MLFRSLAVQSCLFQFNRYKRSATEGREMGMLLSIKTETNSIAVIEKRVRPADEAKPSDHPLPPTVRQLV